MLFYVDLMLVESKLSFNINLLSVIGLCTLHKLCVLCSLNKFIGSKWCSSRTYLGPQLFQWCYSRTNLGPQLFRPKRQKKSQSELDFSTDKRVTVCSCDKTLNLKLVLGIHSHLDGDPDSKYVMLKLLIQFIN